MRLALALLKARAMTSSRLLLALFAVTLAGCAVPATDMTDDEAAASNDEALTAQILVPVTPLSISIPNRVGYRLYTSAADFRSAFGVSATGVDFTREAVIFYAPGSNWSTSTIRMRATRSGDGRSLAFVAQLRTPGRGCFTSIPSRPPYFLGKISRTGLVAAPALGYRTDQLITPCTGSVSLNRCSIAGCPSGQVCRIVDGVDGCVQAPYTCDMVACPIGSACGYNANGTTMCGAPPVPVGQEPGFTVTFPEGLTVTFPTGGIPSACKSVFCGSGKACVVGFDGRAKCVSTSGGGTPN